MDLGIQFDLMPKRAAVHRIWCTDALVQCFVLIGKRSLRRCESLLQ